MDYPNFTSTRRFEQNVPSDTIWDLKYNKRNRLLRMFPFQCSRHEPQMDTASPTPTRTPTNYVDVEKRRKLFRVRANCFNFTDKYDKLMRNAKFEPRRPSRSRSVVYLFVFVLFYCCVLIKASKITIAPDYNALIRDNGRSITNVSQNSHFNSNEQNSTIPMGLFGNSGGDGSTEAHRLAVVGESNSRKRRAAASMADDDYNYNDEDMDEYEMLINNKSAKGKYIGAPCDGKCDATLVHVHCDSDSSTCGCDRHYPVVIGLTKGCDKPKKLGEQCFYHETCIYNDENSLCVQVSHNALCQCNDGYHSVSYSKPTKRVFCTQDIATITSDLPTLLGVSTGIAVLAGLICMVLHLISKTKYPRHRNFGDANLPPPIMYSSDTGIPLTVQSGRPSSRSSIRSSGSIGSYGNRRSSSTLQSGNASKGIMVSTSRTGSRRPSLASVHSTSSSVRSYSMIRFEKEIQQKEIRNEMKLRLARLQQQQHMCANKPQIVIGDAVGPGAIAKVIVPTPSPLTPNSTDELLPSVDETQEFPPTQEKSLGAAYHGPCSSSQEGL